MANVAISDLVNHSRFSIDSIVLILYIPIGLLLFIARAVIGIQLWLISAILPEMDAIKQMYTSFACLTLGTITKPKGRRDKSARLLVSNHVSVFDPLALYMTTGCLSPGKWDLPPTLTSAVGMMSLSRSTTDEEIKNSIRLNYEHNLSCSIAIQPEELPTNGKALLKFKDWPFSLADRIQPVAIEVSRWFGNVTVNSEANLWTEGVPWSDVLWYLFNPCTFYTITWLPIVERRESESDRNFADRVQKAIAEHLQVEATEVTGNELRECVRMRQSPPLPHLTNAPVSSGLLPPIISQRPELQRMATQVKEVLPAVPVSIILKELARTRCVDVTITNILEGGVVYTPETVTATSQESMPGPSTSPQSASKSSMFARNAQERQLSFQERKSQMIETAKRRYIEKHGLNVA